jgi:hypothetical protein
MTEKDVVNYFLKNCDVYHFSFYRYIYFKIFFFSGARELGSCGGRRSDQKELKDGFLDKNT